MENKTRFYMLRHGETIWNRDHNRYCGISDIELSAEGRRQAAQTADFLAHLPIGAVYCSSLQRARECAEIIANRLALSVHTDARLKELDFGEWEGSTATAIAQEYPGLWESWIHNSEFVRAGGTGETGAEVYARAAEVFLELQRRHVNAAILIVGHNTFNRLWLAGTLGMPLSNYRMLSQDNMNITIVEKNAQSCKLIQLNEIGHLSPF